MLTSATTAKWQQGQDALRDEVQRVTTLLRSVNDPTTHALGQWNLGDVAMHLAQAWMALPALAKQDVSRIRELVPSLTNTASEALIREIWELGDMTTQLVKSDSERNLSVLADRIDTHAHDYFRDCVGADPEAPRSWMVEGVTVSLATFTYHLLNETVMHGYDIARAARRSWRIQPAAATMVWGRFIVPILQALDPRAMVNPDMAADARCTYEIRVRGADSYHFIFNDGSLAIEKSSPHRRVDCHISADPVALLIVLWHRQSQWPAIARGKLLAWGRKPWLGFRFRTLMRNP